jgi:hypothetical protein
MTMGRRERMSRENRKRLNLTAKAEAAFPQAAWEVIERTKQTKTPVVVWRDGQVLESPSEQTEKVSALGGYPRLRLGRRPLVPLAPPTFPRYNRGMRKNANSLLLDRILEPVSSVLNEEAALKILTLRADRKTQARVTKLADKCNEGELTPEERREYEMYLLANHFIAILKAKARMLLARKGQPT